MRELNDREWKRWVQGIIQTAVGLLIVAVNVSWLYTGDVHTPGNHIVMRGDWFGFWFSTAAGVTMLIVGGVAIVETLWPPKPPYSD